MREKINNKTKFVNEGDKIYAFKPQSERCCVFSMKEKKLLLRMLLRKNSKNYRLQKKQGTKIPSRLYIQEQ